MHTLVSVFGAVFASKGYPFKNILEINGRGKESQCHKDSMFDANFKDKHIYVDKKLWTDSKQRFCKEHDKAAYAL